MTTTQIIARILKYAPEQTPQSALELLDSLQKLLLQTENDDRLYYDTTTGDFPFLATTQGIFQYNTILNIWKIRNIVINVAVYNGFGVGFPISSALTNNPFFTRSPGLNYGYDVAEIKINNRAYIPVPCQFTEAYQGGTPAAMFRFDPGSQASLYQIMGYVAPIPLTSANTQLSVPVQYHETVVMPAVYSLLDGMNNGRYQEQIQYIEKELKPKIDNNMNKNSSHERITCSPCGW